MVEGERQPEEPPFDIQMDASMVGGVWSNFAVVAHSPHEFTIDFVRLDYSQTQDGKGRGVVVSRVNLSPLMVTQLLQALQTNWQMYAKKALPREVHGDDHDDQA